MAAFRALARTAERGVILKSAVLAVVFCLLCAPAAFAAEPPPLKINLDEFDALKKVVLLPNNEHLAYLDMGDRKGPPVVLIHGYTDNARDWVPLIPYLSRRYRLIVVDIRGHGRSDKPECCYARIDFAYDIKLLLDALHIPKADIVGHSLGSMITQVLAEQWPERVRKVILISSTGGPRPGSIPKKPTYDFASEIRKLHEPIDPDSPFMVQWWDSPKPVNPDFIRRSGGRGQHPPGRVARGSGAGCQSRGPAEHSAETQSAHPADLGQRRSHHGRGRAPVAARGAAGRDCEGV